MSDPAEFQSVERLFPFVIKTQGLLVGRDTLLANKGKLHFVLITMDIAETSRQEVLKNFMHYPVVQYYSAAEFEKFFNIKGAKAVGFKKSGLAQSIYAELKSYRINQPMHPTKPSGIASNTKAISDGMTSITKSCGGQSALRRL